jgi:hypothetical protein
MVAHRFAITVGQDRTLVVRDVPFRPGDRVDVFVVEHQTNTLSERWQRLQGSVIKYDRPTDPVGEDDWED